MKGRLPPHGGHAFSVLVVNACFVTLPRWTRSERIGVSTLGLCRQIVQSLEAPWWLNLKWYRLWDC